MFPSVQRIQLHSTNLEELFGGDGKQKCVYLLEGTGRYSMGTVDWGNKDSLRVERIMSNSGCTRFGYFQLVKLKHLCSVIPVYI